MENFEKYARQTALPDFGAEGQRRLAESSVALVGVGGVGSAVLPLIVGAGFGRVALFDSDTVSAHNLHRQTLYAAAQEGRFKAELAAESAKRLNPDVRVDFFCEKISAENSAEILRESALCIDATDTFEARAEVSALCAAAGIREIAASAAGYVSQNFLFGDGFYFGDVAKSDGSPGAARTADFPRGGAFERRLGGVGSNPRGRRRRLRNRAILDVRPRGVQIFFGKHTLTAPRVIFLKKTKKTLS